MAKNNMCFPPSHKEGFSLKRWFDSSVAAIGLLLSSPLMLYITLAIKRSSPGPILFSQIRIGQYGRPFRMYKFRSMVVNADRLGPSVTTGGDPRITPIGRMLRRTKLDELPQLWNVLCGDMSFVGPRPEVPDMVKNYTPEMMVILNVRPGMTSLASLHLRNEEELLALVKDAHTFYIKHVMPAKISLDMEHVHQNSLRFDLGIVLQTIWVLGLGKKVSNSDHPIVAALRAHALEE